MNERHPSFEHVAVLHDGPAHLVDLLEPDLTEAVRAGHAVLVCTHAETWRPLAARLGNAASRVRYVPDDVRYAQPAHAMRILYEFALASMNAGAASAVSVGSIPFGGDPIANQDWIRYEASVQAVLGHLPLKGVCTYDVATSSPEIIEGACRTHTHVVDAAGWHRRQPEDPTSRQAIPLPTSKPALAAEVTTAREAREQVSSRLGVTVTPDTLLSLRTAVSELVTNALMHGRAPVRLTAWSAPHATIIDVSDCGSGVSDPYFELRPPSRMPGGAGLWIVGQLAQRVTSHTVGTTHHVTARFDHRV